MYVKNVGQLKRFTVAKNISSGSLINLQHVNPDKNNERSENKYCYAVECTDPITGKISYQILGFTNIKTYFGDLTSNDNFSGIVYDVEHSTPDTCFSIAQAIINYCFYIGCSIDKNLSENTINGGNLNQERVFFDKDECSRLEIRLQRGYAQAVGKASNSSSIYDRKIIVVQNNQ